MSNRTKFNYCQEQYDHMTDPKYELPDESEPEEIIIKRKRLSGWYRLVLERKLKRLETALTLLDKADRCIDLDYLKSAKTCLNQANRIIK